MKNYVKGIVIKSPSGVPLKVPECCENCDKIVCDFPCRKYWISLKNVNVSISTFEMDCGIHTHEYVFRNITLWCLMGLVAWMLWLIIPRSNSYALIASQHDKRLMKETLVLAAQGGTNLVGAVENSFLRARDR